MNASIRYTLLRILVFAGTFLVLLAVPPLRDNPIVLLLVAAVVSLVLSLVLLTPWRNAMAREVEDKIEHRMEKKRRSRSYQEGLADEEDAEADAHLASGEPSDPTAR